jgi:hypothetical protein
MARQRRRRWHERLVGYARVSTKQQDLSPAVLSLDGWGDLIFVLALSALALALYASRPEEPATTVLLVGVAGLANTTVIVVAGNHTAGFWPTDRGGRKPHRRVLAHSRRRGNQFYCRCRSPDTCWHSASPDFRSAVLLAHDGVLVVTDRDRNAPGIPVGAMSSAALAGLKLGQVRKSLRARGRASGLLSAR